MTGDLFDPTEEHRMLRELVAEFARREVEPHAAEYDAKGVLNVEGQPVAVMVSYASSSAFKARSPMSW